MKHGFMIDLKHTELKGPSEFEAGYKEYVNMGENEFVNILKPVADLLKRKNTDYGDSYNENRAEYGPISFIIRLNDKFARLKTLIKQEARVENESIEDTLEDIIGYCTLELRFRRKQNKQQGE